MRDVVICEPVRTAVGGFGGAFKTVHAHEMAAHVVRELMVRTKLPAEAVEDCIFAQCYPTMEAPAFGRMIALDAGLTTSTGGSRRRKTSAATTRSRARRRTSSPMIPT